MNKQVQTVSFTINGELKTFATEPDEKLLALLRREGYKGAKYGCGQKLSFHSYSSSHFFTLIQFIAYYIFPSISSYPPVKYLTNFLWFFPVFRAEKTS